MRGASLASAANLARALSAALARRVAELFRRSFKDRQVLLRSESRVACFHLSARVQLLAAGLLAGLTVWALVSSLGFLSLVERWHGWSQDMAAIARERQAASSQRLALDQHLQSLQVDLTRERRLYSSARRQLLSARDSLSGATSSVAALDRDRATLADRVATLEQELEAARTSHSRLVEQLSSRVRGSIGSIEQILSRAGLSVESPSAEADGKGGPLVPMGSLLEALPDETLREQSQPLYGAIERWQRLVERVGRLPLAPPLRRYRISSGFGVRTDPINGRAGRHLGIDMAAPKGSRVRAPGPGRVTRAGWHGSYGRMVEIDHGGGLVTRYGHLHRILVRPGQKLHRGQEIGSVGNTGRSTGSHLHYELLRRGRHLDPADFLRAFRALEEIPKNPLKPVRAAAD